MEFLFKHWIQRGLLGLSYVYMAKYPTCQRSVARLS